ncbi:6-carboxytetrahydropterin synthase [Streptomyces sp. NPDC001093]|uniref:6-pyruvoyl trahydropterin synthase family protein n=1 Tax=Streptomyces sp. NPDC001093 TaxID=3154376 RepID=UPI0033185A76
MATTEGDEPMMTLTHEADFSASHIEPRLPSWHPCARMHSHNWSVTLEASGQENLTENESVAIHTAFAEFDVWVGEQLNHRHLNEVDDALQDHSGPADLAHWVYDKWTDRLPHLAAVRVSGPPVETGDTAPGAPRYRRYEVAYNPADRS